MKQTFTLIFLTLCLALVACSPSTALPSSTNTAVLSTALPSPTNTAVPTATTTSTPAPTATAQPIPDFMKEYIERGLESQSTAGVLYLVLDETKIHYAPLAGILYEERIIRSWYEVDFLHNGDWKHGMILGFVRRGGDGVNQDFGKFILANSGNSITNPSVAWVESVDISWTSRTPGDHTIFRCLLGFSNTSEMPLQAGVDLLFEDVFPMIEDKAQSITIEDIGEVLPVTQCEIAK